MFDRVLERKNRAPRVAEQDNRIKMEELPNFVEISNIGSKRDIFRTHVLGRPAAAALVVIDEAIRIRKTIHLREEIGVIEIRTTVQNDDGSTRSDLTGIEFRPADWNTMFPNLF